LLKDEQKLELTEGKDAEVRVFDLAA